MRVGFVIDDLDPRRGGMSQWCSQFVAAVARRNCELHIICMGFGDGPLPEQIVCHTIPRTKSRIGFAAAAENILRELQLDVVHDSGLGWQFDIFQPHGGAYGAWRKRRLDFYPPWIRALKRPIDALLPRQRSFHQHAKRQYAALSPDKTIVALSKSVADDFVRLHGIRPEQIKVVYNGVDCHRFSPVHRARHREAIRQRLGIEPGTLVLLLTAHNFRLKGVPELLKAAARLAISGRQIHVLIAGGKRLQKWRRKAASLGLAERATFLGAVANLVPYYAAADACVHPTYYDPCSLVLLEAAASGLPIVTTRRFNGAAELFREGDEILITNEPTDHETLCGLIDALFDERLRTRLGCGARNAASRHPFTKNVDEIFSLYEHNVRRKVAA
ncbi:MAG TPA: glycosyltransferase family 4 protein [Lacipirellulaceae bacterium]|nr:glycosyltransferase family 4 protein [Lacipirellulaceae bacterium]